MTAIVDIGLLSGGLDNHRVSVSIVQTECSGATELSCFTASWSATSDAPKTSIECGELIKLQRFLGCPSGTQWNSVELSGTQWNSVEFSGIQTNPLPTYETVRPDTRELPESDNYDSKC